MLDLSALYLITKLVALVASYLIVVDAKTDVVAIIISVLSFVCVFVLEFLLERLLKKKSILFITISASIIGCFFIGIEILLPLMVVLVLHLCELLLSRDTYYQVGATTMILIFFVFPTSMTISILSIILIIMIMLSRLIIIKKEDLIERNETLQEKITKLEGNIADLNGLMKTLKKTASMEERNRIAARIHDEIGHGISGSIILLEAAMLQMRDDHKKAIGTVDKAIINHRESVD